MTDQRSKSSAESASRISSPLRQMDLSSPFPRRPFEESFNRSVLATPVLTPNTNRVAMLSPSQTISESLSDLAAKTGDELEKLWDIIGLDPKDRATELSRLVLKFRECCDAKIADEKSLVEDYRREIDENKRKIQATAAALKEDIDFRKLNASSSMTLNDELASTGAILEGLQTKADRAMREFTGLYDFLVESHNLLGLEMDSQWKDIQSDLTSSRLEQYRDKKLEMERELSSRTSAIIQLIQGWQALMIDLKLDAEVDGTELDRRIASSFVPKEGKVTLTSRLRTDTSIGISSQAIEELTTRSASLHKEKERRKAKLTEMGHEISMLWEKLKVPQEEQLAFSRYVQVHGLGHATIEKGEEELERLRVLKSEKISSLIVEAREKISVLWEQTSTPEESKRAFESFYIMDEFQFDDELLWEHDGYIKSLEKRLKEMQPILRLIEKREVIVSERIEYERLQQRPDRFHQAGAALTRQLMAEEKMAKRIKRDLPKITELLGEKLGHWMQEHDEEFVYRGQVYSERMKEQEAEWVEFKETIEMERKRKKNKQEDAKDKQSQRPLVENRNGKPHRGGDLKRIPSSRFQS